jgi:ATP phosphoribosyltransferase
MSDSIRMGIPKGNLNRSEGNRGFTSRLLELAGWVVDGYEPRREGKPWVVSGEEGIELTCYKPRNLFQLFKEGMLDCMIVGSDIVKEECCPTFEQDFYKNDIYERLVFGGEILNGNVSECEDDLTGKNYGWFRDFLGENKTVCWREYNLGLPSANDLGYGRVDVVFGVRESDWGEGFPENLDHRLRIATAYPKITSWVMFDCLKESENLTYVNYLENFSFVRSQKKRDMRDRDVIPFYEIVNNSGSDTEKLVADGIADICIDCVSSGGTFEKNGIIRVGTLILESTAGFYVRAMIPEWKRKRVKMIGDKLERAARKEYSQERKDSIWYSGSAEKDQQGQ